MISISLFNESSVYRIAGKASRILSEQKNLRISDDKIWLDGMYIKFSPRLIAINVFNPLLYTGNLQDIIKQMLIGEEVYISSDNDWNKYIELVDSSTVFDFPCNS